jgi:hypothetical protein
MSRILSIILSIAASAALAFGQVDGRLTGSVVDPSGSAVPDATVNVYLPGGQTPVLAMKTTSAGIFDFISVRPAIYRVEVVAAGFNIVAQNNVAVDPVRQTTLAAIQLEISSTKQTVEVTSSGATVETGSVEVNSTVTQSQVLNLPVLDRQINNLFYTQPGVNNNGSADTSINGVRAQNTNVTLDGINIQDNFIRINGLDYLPNKLTIGEVQELTISSSNADAQLGGNASVISLVSPSGTNTFHGSAYWYNRNDAFSANDWFNNTDGVARPFLNLNQFGGTIGGPIKKDKLFFYAAYETYDYHSTTPETATILTPSAREGIFTYRTNGDGPIQTYNLLQNPGIGLPSVSIDPVVAKLLGQVPTVGNSTQVGDGLNTTGYQFNARANERRDSVEGKVDYNLSTKNVFSATYRWNRDNLDRPDLFSGFSVVSPVSNHDRADFFAASWRWTPTPNLTNQVRGGGNLTTAPFNVAGTLPTELVEGTLFTDPQNAFLAQGRTTNTYNLQDNAGWVHGNHSVSFGFQMQQVRVTPYNYGGIVPTYTLGVYSANQPYGYNTGDIPGADAVDTNTANLLLGTLGGMVQSAAQSYNVTSQTSGFVPGAPSIQHLSFNGYGGYISDTWKLRRNLTAIIGVRYDYFPTVQEQNGLLIQPELINNNPAETLLSDATLTFQGKHLYNAQKTNFAPNVGLAWSPRNNLVLRAGYSITYAQDDILEAVLNTVTVNTGLTGNSAIPNASGFISSPPALTTPAFQIPITTQQNFVNTSDDDVQGLISPNLKAPYVQQWNFTVEEQWKGLIFDAGYIGNHAVGLLRQIDYNQINVNQSTFLPDFKSAYNNGILSLNAGQGFNPSYNAAIPGSAALPFFNNLPGGGYLTNATVSSDILTQQVGNLAQFYQQNSIFPGNLPNFSYFPNPLTLYSSLLSNFSQSTYNGLQLQVRKRTSSGLQFQASYVYSKTFSDTSVERGLDALLDNNTPSIERARAPWDQTQAFKLNYYYPVPAGAGHRFSAHGLNWLLGNWGLSGFVTDQSGAPVSVLSARGTLNRSARSAENTVDTTDTLSELNSLTGVFMTGNGPYYISPSAISANGTGAAPDGSAPFTGQVFFNPAAGTVGSLQRRILSGPWFNNYDMAIRKSIKITERQQIDLRADFYNFFNHPSFFVGDQNINAVNFGKITQQFYAADGVGPRVVQFGLYYRF